MIELLWNSPTSEESMRRQIEALDLAPTAAVLDVGCGCGEVLLRIHERFGATGEGVDSSQQHIDEAIRRRRSRAPESAVRFTVADARSIEAPPGGVDLALCLGATHALGGGESTYRDALEKLAEFVMPGGHVLIADGYLKQPAAPEYRRLLGDSVPETMTHAHNVEVGVECGLTPLAAWTCSEDEWDNFEWGYQRIVERRAAERPDDAAAAAKLANRRAWMKAYLRYGRDTLGYGTYLFRKWV